MRDGVETRYCRSDEVGISVTSSRTREREANRFAGALLMPEPLMRAEAVRLRCNVALLARGFGVSEPAMRVRLTQLDLLPDYMR
jgi:Zn-dependent peptidase ImmA (M78 family)